MTVRQAVASPAATPSPILEAASKAPFDQGRALFDLLRQKWKEVPAGLYDRVDTGKVLALTDWELRDYWDGVWHEFTVGTGYATRGWYQEMYRDMFRGKRVLEIGSGCGIDGIEFIRQGAIWYFADIVPNNLKLIRRMLDAFGLDCEGMTYIEDLRSLEQIPDGFDFIYCNGSMINVPFDFARRETLHLVSHLRPGGRWVELCYPRERWAREGRLPFADWGRMTDGDATPWVEWYDMERLRDRFAPVALNPLMAFNYYNDDFNWFDFRVEAVPDRRQVAAYLASAGARRLPVNLAPGAFKRHGTSRIEAVTTADGPALRVQTTPQIWSYAIHGTLGAATLRQAVVPEEAAQSVPAIELTLSVQQGRIGVGLMADDLTNFINLERHFTPRDEPYVVTLACPPGYERYNLMLRNTQGGDQASAFTIHQMVLTSHRADEQPEAQAGAGPERVIALTSLVRRYLPAIQAENPALPAIASDPKVPIFARALALDELDRALGYAEPALAIAAPREKDLRVWSSEPDDAPVLAYLHRNHRPARQLVLGASSGFDASLCAAESTAEIWALDLAESACADAAARIHRLAGNGRPFDGAAFAAGFFDAVAIAGRGHAAAVIRDTEAALPLLRSGGMIVWRGFCPLDGPMAALPELRATVYGVHQGWRRWSSQFASLFWIRPSYLLVGIKR
ncbi:MAG: class I SAM-dependent methyltransferase [Alphaproteobacteria bacterium]|nr:class I SAM-dependent methyltransferase [Alphaproteobacteria bacterium]